MATRAYYRDSHGRFHGSSGGRVTFGKAGGFLKGHGIRGGGGQGGSRVGRRLGARKKTQYYVQASYVKSTRTATAALLKRNVTAGAVTGAGKVVRSVSVKVPRIYRPKKRK